MGMAVDRKAVALASVVAWVVDMVAAHKAVVGALVVAWEVGMVGDRMVVALA